MDSSYLNPDEFGLPPARRGSPQRGRAERLSKRTISSGLESYYDELEAMRTTMEATPGTSEPVSQLGDELLKRDEMG
jgi:hypothetical protein